MSNAPATVGQNDIAEETHLVPRQDWEAQYQRMAENGDDALLDGDVSSMTKWDEA